MTTWDWISIAGKGRGPGTVGTVLRADLERGPGEYFARRRARMEEMGTAPLVPHAVVWGWRGITHVGPLISAGCVWDLRDDDVAALYQWELGVYDAMAAHAAWLRDTQAGLPAPERAPGELWIYQGDPATWNDKSLHRTTMQRLYAAGAVGVIHDHAGHERAGGWVDREIFSYERSLMHRGARGARADDVIGIEAGDWVSRRPAHDQPLHTLRVVLDGPGRLDQWESQVAQARVRAMDDRLLIAGLPATRYVYVLRRSLAEPGAMDEALRAARSGLNIALNCWSAHSTAERLQEIIAAGREEEAP